MSGRVTVGDRPDRGRRTLFVFVALAIYAVIVTVVAIHHEPWRDEADSWLLVRDASLSEIISIMPYAGTPALWYLVLLPFAKLGFPYASEFVIHGLIAVAAAAVFLSAAPFSRILRVLFLLSYYPAYEYAVIARSYVLTVLLSFSVAALWSRRMEAPLPIAVLLLLLGNSNSHGFLIAGILAVIFLFDIFRGAARLRWPSAAVALGGLALAWIQIRTPPDAALRLMRRPPDPAEIVRGLGNAFLPGADVAFSSLVGAALLILATVALRSRFRAILFLWSATAALLGLFVFVWAGGLRHYGLLLIVFVVALWIGRSSTPRESEESPLVHATLIVLSFCLAFSVGTAGRTWFREIREPFSGSTDMASFLRRHHLSDMPIAAHFATLTEAVLPQLGARSRFWYPGIESWGSYMKWDRAYEEGMNVPYPQAVARAEKHFLDRPWLLLLAAEMPAPEQKGYRLLHRTPARPFGNGNEEFFLYEPTGRR